MGSINYGRVLLGGLIAGVLINFFEFAIHGVLLSRRWASAMTALGRTQEIRGGILAASVIWGFLIGIVAIWLYAGIRPRYGAGPLTAARVACAVWFLGYLTPALGQYAMKLFPGDLMLIAAAVGLVEIMTATVLGAWPYKEGFPEKIPGVRVPAA